MVEMVNTTQCLLWSTNITKSHLNIYLNTTKILLKQLLETVKIWCLTSSRMFGSNIKKLQVYRRLTNRNLLYFMSNGIDLMKLIYCACFWPFIRGELSILPEMEKYFFVTYSTHWEQVLLQRKRRLEWKHNWDELSSKSKNNIFPNHLS